MLNVKRPQETADLVTFSEEIHNGKLSFLSSVYEYVVKELQVNSLITNVPLNQLTCFYTREALVVNWLMINFSSKAFLLASCLY